MQLKVTESSKTITASQFVTGLMNQSRSQREESFLNALLQGLVPQHMKSFVEVPFSFIDANSMTHSIVLNVLPDYLKIGTDDDSFRVPLWPLTAQKIADAWECVLPTTRIVSLLWQHAVNKLPPQPWGPPYDASMMSTQRIVDHNKRVEVTAKSLSADLSKLTAGHKKDVVITNKLVVKPQQVAIFGWHQLNGKNIQPLYLGHENTYADYSHGIRMISFACTLDGQPDDVRRIMQDPILHGALVDHASDEGPMKLVRQPGV